MITKQMLTDFRTDVIDALQDVAKKYNVEIRPNGITYDDIQFTMQLKVTEIGDEAENGSQAAWNHYCTAYGLEKEDYNKIVILNGKKYQIKNINTSSYKNPIVIEQLDNHKTYKCSVGAIKDALEKID